MISKILKFDCHAISTLRVYQDYVIQDKGTGKMVAEKAGLKAIQRASPDYYYTSNQR
jgi:hypothetical protein